MSREIFRLLKLIRRCSSSVSTICYSTRLHIARPGQRLSYALGSRMVESFYRCSTKVVESLGRICRTSLKYFIEEPEQLPAEPDSGSRSWTGLCVRTAAT